MKLKSLKKEFRRISRQSPRAYRLAAQFYHAWQYVAAYTRERFTLAPGAISPQAVLSVDPSRIRYANFDLGVGANQASFPEFRGIAEVRSGDWDRPRTDIDQIPIASAMREHFLNGRDIRQLDYYGGSAPPDQPLTSGAWHRVYEQNCQEQIERWDRLYESIRRNGYKSQKEIGSADPFDEIAVRIGRDGELLFQNSIHRLLIAKLLRIPSVPVVVTARHAEWMKIRERFRKFAGTREGGKLYGRLSHPDLADIPHHHDCDRRLEVIERQLRSASRAAALDLGADLGIFSQMLDRLGYDCIAVERDMELAKCTALLRDIEGRRFEILVGDILAPDVISEICSRKYSVVLALNIFHHFLKKEESFQRFKGLLGRLQMESMIFQAHDPAEPQMQAAFLNPDPDSFAELIMRHSCLTEAEQIGVAADGRKIFLLRG